MEQSTHLRTSERVLPISRPPEKGYNYDVLDGKDTELQHRWKSLGINPLGVWGNQPHNGSVLLEVVGNIPFVVPEKASSREMLYLESTGNY